ncbi:MAG: hypothetical protein AAFO94_14215, partial [Bacteroidota bacterium]
DAQLACCALEASALHRRYADIIKHVLCLDDGQATQHFKDMVNMDEELKALIVDYASVEADKWPSFIALLKELDVDVFLLLSNHVTEVSATLLLALLPTLQGIIVQSDRVKMLLEESIASNALPAETKLLSMTIPLKAFA